MEKKEISVNPSFVKAEIERGVCPLNWLAEFYKEYDGKLVMLDKELVSFLLNDSHCDAVLEMENSDRVQRFDIYWLRTEKYPESIVSLASCGEHKIEKDEDGRYNVYSDANYYVIEELKAEDIITDTSKPYAYKSKDDQQILMLVAEELNKGCEV